MRTLTVTFTGAGLNDCSARGPDAAITAATYTAVIDHTGATDSFKWRKDAGAWVEDVLITGGWQDLSDDVQFKFAAITGHTAADQWAATTLENENIWPQPYGVKGRCPAVGVNLVVDGTVAFQKDVSDTHRPYSNLLCHRIKTGSYTTIEGNAMVTKNTYEDRLFYVVSDDLPVISHQIKCSDTVDGTVLWTHEVDFTKFLGGDYSYDVACGGTAYVQNSNLFIIEDKILYFFGMVTTEFINPNYYPHVIKLCCYETDLDGNYTGHYSHVIYTAVAGVFTTYLGITYYDNSGNSFGNIIKDALAIDNDIYLFLDPGQLRAQVGGWCGIGIMIKFSGGSFSASSEITGRDYYYVGMAAGESNTIVKSGGRDIDTNKGTGWEIWTGTSKVSETGGGDAYPLSYFFQHPAIFTHSDEQRLYMGKDNGEVKGYYLNGTTAVQRWVENYSIFGNDYIGFGAYDYKNEVDDEIPIALVMHSGSMVSKADPYQSPLYDWVTTVVRHSYSNTVRGLVINEAGYGLYVVGLNKVYGISPEKEALFSHSAKGWIYGSAISTKHLYIFTYAGSGYDTYIEALCNTLANTFSAISSTPATDETDVATDSTIRIDFTENVDYNSITADNLQVEVNGAPVTWTLKDCVEKYVEITPDASFPDDAKIEVTCTTQIQSVLGTYLTEQYEFTFYTGGVMIDEDTVSDMGVVEPDYDTDSGDGTFEGDTYSEHTDIWIQCPHLNYDDPQWMLHFKIAAYADAEHNTLIEERSSEDNPELFHYSANRGTTWEPFPAAGLGPDQYYEVTPRRLIKCRIKTGKQSVAYIVPRVGAEGVT